MNIGKENHSCPTLFSKLEIGDTLYKRKHMETHEERRHEYGHFYLKNEARKKDKTVKFVIK